NWLARLSSLSQLWLDQCNLQSLPPQIGRLTWLRELSLSNERNLATLPDDVTSLRSLVVLRCANCRLTSLPAKFGALTSLCELDLSGNILAALPSSFGALTRLERLELSGNPLEPALWAALASATTLRECVDVIARHAAASSSAAAVVIEDGTRRGSG